MDHMRSHFVREEAETLHAAGTELWYLPPYNPDMNPIEMLWSKAKALLRKWECRAAELLPETVSRAFSDVGHQDCTGWFGADGDFLNFESCYKTGRGTYEKNLFNTMLVYHWLEFYLM